MVTAKAFAPCHITGFFQIFDEAANPLSIGSRGAGVSLEKGIWTQVTAEKSSDASVKIWINDSPVSDAEVSLEVVRLFREKFPELSNFSIEVRHKIEMPIGAGFGTSGAGALSLAAALNAAFGLGMTRLQVAQIAHVAEVNCRTGLGTVIAETFGGVEIRVKPGAPGIGRLVQIPLSQDLEVVCLFFGALPTKRLLADQDLRRIVNAFGGKLVDELLQDPSIEKLMELSRKFAEFVGLMTPRIKEILKATDEAGILCSVPMFGDALFSIVDAQQVPQIVEIFRRFKNDGKIILSKIDTKGVRG
ncbi:MAG: hypothetical protein DRQ10_03040 [Candidatus Hydrothermota bacterium]|nr:MAG: hypothetical protein DRQ10_03040 [Candidatus Hydrothermae bacterium]